MDDCPARSMDTLKQRALELEIEITRIRREIQAAGNRQPPLLTNELQNAPCRMDDLERQADIRSPAVPFFLF